jgi:hypothetical protein
MRCSKCGCRKRRNALRYNPSPDEIVAELESLLRSGIVNLDSLPPLLPNDQLFRLYFVTTQELVRRFYEAQNLPVPWYVDEYPYHQILSFTVFNRIADLLDYDVRNLKVYKW